MQIDKVSGKRIILIASFIVLLFWGLNNYLTVINLIQNILGIMAPFIIGGCFAFIINLPLGFIEEKLHKIMPTKAQKYIKMLSITISMLFVAAILCMVLFLVLPELIKTLMLMPSAITHFFGELGKFAESIFAEYPDFQNYFDIDRLDWQVIINNMAAMLQTLATDLLNSTVSITGSVVSGIINAVLSFFFAIYSLAQKDELIRLGKATLYAYFSEKRADRAVYILSLTNKTFRKFVTGQCTESVIIGIMFFFTMLVFQMPHALMISVLAGFTALIPIFGTFIGCGIGFFLILMLNPMQAVWFLLMCLVIQQVEGNLIYPKVVGVSVGLPPIWVLLAFTIGAGTMGVIGMLTFIPMASVLYTLITKDIETKIKENKINPKKFEG